MQTEQYEQTARQIVDGATVTAALTSPLWLDWIERGAGMLMLFGGIALLGLRLAIAWHEWKSRDKG